jgi:hypothetical protein
VEGTTELRTIELAVFEDTVADTTGLFTRGKPRVV